MIQDFYNSSALVESISRGTTGMGGPQKTYTTRIAALKCRLSNKRISETDEFGRMTVRECWWLYCDATSTNKAIEANDRITVEGKVFEVDGSENPGFLDHHLEIDLKEVR